MVWCLKLIIGSSLKERSSLVAKRQKAISVVGGLHKMMPVLLGFCIVMYSGMLDFSKCAVPECQIDRGKQMSPEWVPMGEKIDFLEGEIPQAYCLKLKDADVQH